MPNAIADHLPAVRLGSGVSARCVISGSAHSCVVTTDSRLKCWGSQSHGQLGTGSTTSHGHARDTMGDFLPFVDIGATPCCPGEACYTMPPPSPFPEAPPLPPPNPPSSPPGPLPLEPLNLTTSESAQTIEGASTVDAETAGAAVSAVLATTMVSSTMVAVGSSIAASIGGSAASAVTGSISSSATSSSAAGGAGSGAIMPLVFGAQRFVFASDGMAVSEPNTVQVSVASNLAWLTGDFGAVTPSPDTPADSSASVSPLSSRRLEEAVCSSKAPANMAALSKLQRRLYYGFISILILIAVQLVIIGLFRFVINRTYYRHKPKALADLKEKLSWKGSGHDELSDMSILRRRSQRDASHHSSAPADQGFSNVVSPPPSPPNNKAEQAAKADEPALGSKAGNTMDRPPRFRKYPGLLVFPGFLTLVINFFALGICSTSVEVLVTAPGCCGPACYWPAIPALTLIALHLGVGFCTCQYYHRRFRVRTWQPFAVPDSMKEIEDPIYRMLDQYVYARLGWKLRDRSVGVFAHDAVEPNRTHRLLARPWRLFYTQAPDQLDALKLTWMSRATGGSLHGIFYDFYMFAVMTVVATLNGLRSILVPGSPQAMAQIAVILSLQFGFAAYVVWLWPSNDRLDSLLIAIQYTIEGAQTVLTLQSQQSLSLGSVNVTTELTTSINTTASTGLVHRVRTTQSSLLVSALICGVVSMMLPVLFKIYDLVCLLCTADRKQCLNVAITCCACLLPGMGAGDSLQGSSVSSDGALCVAANEVGIAAAELAAEGTDVVFVEDELLGDELADMANEVEDATDAMDTNAMDDGEALQKVQEQEQVLEEPVDEVQEESTLDVLESGGMSMTATAAPARMFAPVPSNNGDRNTSGTAVSKGRASDDG